MVKTRLGRFFCTFVQFPVSSLFLFGTHETILTKIARSTFAILISLFALKKGNDHMITFFQEKDNHMIEFSWILRWYGTSFDTNVV